MAETSRTYMIMDPGEEVILVAHRHWISILPIVFSTTVLLALIAYAEGWFLAHPNVLPSNIPGTWVHTALMGLSVLVILIALVSYLIFRQNRILLTNRHYIQVTQNGLFDRIVSKLTLDEIQDCKGTRAGVLATILNYGEILIETAGEEENFDFSPVRDPLNTAEVVNDAHQKYGHSSKAPAPWATASSQPPDSSDAPNPSPPDPSDSTVSTSL